MRIVLQRVTRASVSVAGSTVSSIGHGLILLVAAGADDRPGEIEKLARKLFELRIFADSAGKMNLLVSQVGGEILVVPQFTLYGDVRRGRRPSWSGAASPEEAAEAVESLALALEALGARVSRGAFREHMDVELLNDGPVTLVIDGADL
jgi:D-tyrosyl-tRNA(Tyr) deacylase